jgi:hypothetical protein
VPSGLQRVPHATQLSGRLPFFQSLSCLQIDSSAELCCIIGYANVLQVDTERSGMFENIAHASGSAW